MRQRFEDEQWKKSMRIVFDFNNMMADMIEKNRDLHLSPFFF